jgi:hypothetical protein
MLISARLLGMKSLLMDSIMAQLVFIGVYIGMKFALSFNTKGQYIIIEWGWIYLITSLQFVTSETTLA